MKRTIEERLRNLERRVTTLSLYGLEISPLSTLSVWVNDSLRDYTNRGTSAKYLVTISEEILRLLTTPLGSRVMRPEYGSELYKLRDREFNNEWRLLAIRYTFVAINRHIKRVRCRKVTFEVKGDGRVGMNLELESRA
jgi:phage baseplate assembly protein W